MAFWNVTAGSQVSAFDANGFAEGTDVDQGSIRAMSTGTVFTANTKFTNVPLGEDNPIVTIASGQAGITGANMTAPFPQNADQVITRIN